MPSHGSGLGGGGATLKRLFEGGAHAPPPAKRPLMSLDEASTREAAVALAALAASICPPRPARDGSADAEPSKSPAAAATGSPGQRTGPVYTHAVTGEPVTPLVLPVGADGLPLAGLSTAQRATLAAHTHASRPTTYICGTSQGFPHGWIVLERVRLEGRTTGVRDRYYLSPQGEVIRQKSAAVVRAGLAPASAASSPSRSRSPPEAVSAAAAAPAQPAGAQGAQGAPAPAGAQADPAVAVPPLRVSQIEQIARLHAAGRLQLDFEQRDALTAALAATLPSADERLAALSPLLEREPPPP